MTGASSSAVHGLRLSDGRRVVLRRYAWPGFLAAEPDAPGREVDALRCAAEHQLPVPDVLGADLTGEEVGDGVPALLMTYLPGRAVAIPDLVRLAETAASIHDTEPPATFPHVYSPWGSATGPPPGSTQPRLWEKAIELWHTATPAYRPTLIHRDFHPGNVLWSRRHLSGIVDWANACRGPRGCDVATCRSNLIDLGGAGVADEFVAAYQDVTGDQHDPYWDMASILEAEASCWTPQRIAQHEPRLARAVTSIASLRGTT
jgi:aminoglycoside phosphotransferase (APT) family kinase protein